MRVEIVAVPREIVDGVCAALDAGRAAPGGDRWCKAATASRCS